MAQFHWVKEQLRDLYRTASLEEAKAILDRILFEGEGASDAALVKWGRTLKRWKNEILADHTWRTTNGDTEGVLTKINRLKRIRYGFKNREVYARKMLLAFIPLAHLIGLITLFDMEPRGPCLSKRFSLCWKGIPVPQRQREPIRQAHRKIDHR